MRELGAAGLEVVVVRPGAFTARAALPGTARPPARRARDPADRWRNRDAAQLRREPGLAARGVCRAPAGGGRDSTPSTPTRRASALSARWRRAQRTRSRRRWCRCPRRAPRAGRPAGRLSARVLGSRPAVSPAATRPPRCSAASAFSAHRRSLARSPPRRCHWARRTPRPPADGRPPAGRVRPRRAQRPFAPHGDPSGDRSRPERERGAGGRVGDLTEGRCGSRSWSRSSTRSASPRAAGVARRQSGRPDRLLLVDDGSRRRVPAIATASRAGIECARAARRRRAAAAATGWRGGSALRPSPGGSVQLEATWDVVAKLDADLRLTAAPRWRTLERELLADPRLGDRRVPTWSAARARTALPAPPPLPAGSRRWRDQVLPPGLLGADRAAPVDARLGHDRRGPRALARLGHPQRRVPGGDPLHLRAMGGHDGLLRGYRRWGSCAWVYGEHPLHVLAVAVQRLGDRPPVLGSVNYVLRLGARRRCAACRGPSPSCASALPRRPPAGAAPAPYWAAGPALPPRHRRDEPGGGSHADRPVPQRGGAPARAAAIARQAATCPDRPAAGRRRLARRLGRDRRDASPSDHPFATCCSGPARRPERDRMAGAHELRAFAWGLDPVRRGCDVAASSTPTCARARTSRRDRAPVRRRAAASGWPAPYLALRMPADGRVVRQRCAAGACRGRDTFYRRALPRGDLPAPGDPRLGHDRRGSRADARLAHPSFPIPRATAVHLRRIGSHDGVLRGYRRAGLAAFATAPIRCTCFSLACAHGGSARCFAAARPTSAGWLLAALAGRRGRSPSCARSCAREHRAPVRARPTQERAA